MKQQPTLPTFGEIVPGEGGRLGAIVRGNVVDGVRHPDYAIIVPDLTGVALQWGQYGTEIAGAGSLSDGLANTAAMLKANCPPAMHIAGLKTDEGHADLYLPAQGEMWALRNNVPELFEKRWHWTSTQGGRGDAFVQDFELGHSLSNWHWDSKVNGYVVRPVRRIPLYHFNA